jgi:hypothetical protein
MSKVTDLTIDVTAKITVDRQTAERCLRILEWYANDNNELMLMGDRDNEGKVHFYFRRADGKERE